MLFIRIPGSNICEHLQQTSRNQRDSCQSALKKKTEEKAKKQGGGAARGKKKYKRGRGGGGITRKIIDFSFPFMDFSPPFPLATAVCIYNIISASIANPLRISLPRDI